MNELQRQAYLSSLGIENYMPRWHLPAAPASVACVLPIAEVSPVVSGFDSAPVEVTNVQREVRFSSSLLDSLIKSDKQIGKVSSGVNTGVILHQLEEKKASVIQPFSLSLWRPVPGFLIVDARNSQLALPTELLLGNILRAYLEPIPFALNEEVMRWPMIENRFVSHRVDAARNELQTWLTVENELRPINRLWLMGENAANYFLPEGITWADCCWQTENLDDLSVQAMIFPSLISLLQQPQQKAKLYACLL